MVGYSEAELRDKTYAALRHPDDLAQRAAPTMTQGGEWRGLRKDGAAVWLELHVTAFPDKGRSGAADDTHVTVVTDVTGHKRTEEALRQSEGRFSQAFNAGPVAACITTLGVETVLEVNEAFTELTGYRQEDVVGRSCDELGMWASATDQAALRREQDAAGNIRNLELKLRTKAGEARDVVLSSGMVSLEGHHGHLRMFHDITRRKEAEVWLELLRQAMDNAEEVVVVTSADLDPPGPRIIYVNAAFTKMTGYAPDEVIGRTPRLFQGPQSDRAVLRRMRRQLERGRAFRGEIVNYRKDGTPFILAWDVAPIRGDEGTLTHYVSTQHDVTKRRGLERELLDISAREQRRVAGDLHDSVQQQLIGTAMQAKRLLDVTKVETPELADRLGELYASIQEGVRSVRTVLSNITPVQPTENGLMVALTSMCQRVTTLFGTPCTFSFEQPLLMHDFERATHLYYIVQEAAINAAKHAGATRIDVRLAGSGAGYTLTVIDDGRGISEEVMQHRGMGLELMDYRAKLLGVALEVSSVPGQGTTVSCSFDDADNVHTTTKDDGLRLRL